jgi:hypothetical protein
MTNPARVVKVTAGLSGWVALYRWNPLLGAVGCAVAGFIAAAVAMRYSRSARIAAGD